MQIADTHDKKASEKMIVSICSCLCFDILSMENTQTQHSMWHLNQFSEMHCILLTTMAMMATTTTTKNKSIRTVSKSNATIMQVNEFETGKLTPNSNRNNEMFVVNIMIEYTIESYQILSNALYSCTYRTYVSFSK